MTILEAQRLGVCVIATDVGAVAEVIATGRTGLAWEIGQAAAATARSWADSAAPLVAWLGGQATRDKAV
jgi:glycosyltransferase involved in cell wall biosynthesis